jgi:head-tail adaptor
MSFGSRLTHTVSIVRKADAHTLNDYGQPVTSDTVIATVKAAIQPRQASEQAATSQAGPAIADYVIFMFPTDLSTADAIFHDRTVCPLVRDLPTARFELQGVPNAAGLGHHLEVQARLIESAQLAAGS